MIDENQLLELCQYFVKFGRDNGATAIEILANWENDTESDIEMSEVSSVNRKAEAKIAIRVFVGKKIGAAFTNLLNRTAIESAVEMAIAAAKVTTENEEWQSLPYPGEYTKLNGLWDENIPQTDPSVIVSKTSEIIQKGIEAEPGLIPAFGGAGVGYTISAYANSNGINHSERGTWAYAVLAAIAQIEGGVTPSMGAYDIKRDLNLDIDDIIEKVASLIRICKNTSKGESGKHTVILHPFAYSQLFAYTVLESIRGDNVARGKSKMADRMGEKIASECLTIFDDGLYPTGINTSMADDEGVPKQRTPVIEKGILRSFIWDTYWANKMDVDSTGNAKRNARQGLVEISPTTIVVNSGTREFANILSDVKHGYYIQNVQGAHSSNPQSGDFSVVGNPAILIENGEAKGAIHGLMISGNAFEILNQIVEIAKTPHQLLSTVGPEIVFEDMQVITKT